MQKQTKRSYLVNFVLVAALYGVLFGRLGSSTGITAAF